MSPVPVTCAAFCLEDTVSQVRKFTLLPLKLEPSPSLWSPSRENRGADQPELVIRLTSQIPQLGGLQLVPVVG